MNNDYTLTEKEARLDMLTAEERTKLQEDMSERNYDYMVGHIQGRDMQLGYRHNNILNNIARQAGFDGYHKDGRGNTFMETNERVSDGVYDSRLQKFHRLLAESPEYRQFQKDSKQATADDMRFFAESTQKMYHDALRIAIPGLLERGEGWELPTDHKPVILQGDEVKSIFLNNEESTSIEKGRTIAAKRLDKKVFQPVFTAVHKVMGARMDDLARQVGFDRFDENEQGTGLRNYTAQGKHMTPAIKAQVDEYDRLYTADPTIRKCLKHLSKLMVIQESMIRALNQVMLRNMLALTNERMTRVDAAGRPILTPEKYLEATKDMDEEERRLFNEPFTTWIETNGSDKGHFFPVDRGIADFVKQINDIGYRTGQSCSGLLSDHPNYRYVEDSKRNLYVKGECINYNKQGSAAYLTFYKEFNHNKVNTPEQIDDIRRIAAEQGWIVEDMNIFGDPSVRLGLPYTYDGMGVREILHLANDITNERYPGLEKEDFLEWLDRRNEVAETVAKEHGGVVRWTDDMIRSRWQKLTQSLVQAQRERMGIDRISDVRIYKGGDGQWRIKCRIDGVDMLSERFYEAMKIQHDRGVVDARILAARCYQEQLQPKQQQDKGIKL